MATKSVSGGHGAAAQALSKHASRRGERGWGRESVCVCVCVCVGATLACSCTPRTPFACTLPHMHTSTSSHTHTHTHMHHHHFRHGMHDMRSCKRLRWSPPVPLRPSSHAAGAKHPTLAASLLQVHLLVCMYVYMCVFACVRGG